MPLPTPSIALCNSPRGVADNDCSCVNDIVASAVADLKKFLRVKFMVLILYNYRYTIHS
jgi:hypothetical protein